MKRILSICCAVASALLLSCGFDETTAPDADPTWPAGWTRGPDLPRPMLRFGAAVYRGELFIAGGQVGPEQGTRAAWRLRSLNGVWEPLPELPEPNAGGRLVVAADTLFLVGGGNPSNEFPGGSLLAWDPITSRWFRRPPLPDARTGFAAVVVGGTIYVFGGEVWRPNEHTPTVPGDTLLEYDVARGEWRYTIALPTPRIHVAGANLGGEVYVIGGTPLYGNPPPPFVDQMEVLDPQGRRWKNGRSDRYPGVGVAAAVVDGRLHIFGGTNLFDVGTAFYHRYYDSERGAWVRMEPMGRRRVHATAVPFDGHIVVMGGISDEDRVVVHVDAFATSAVR